MDRNGGFGKKMLDSRWAACYNFHVEKAFDPQWLEVHPIFLGRLPREGRNDERGLGRLAVRWPPS